MHIVSVSLALLSLLWHLVAFITYLAGGQEPSTKYLEEKASSAHAVLWFIEIIPFCFIFASHLRIAIASGGFIPLTPQLIDELELDQFHYLMA